MYGSRKNRVKRRRDPTPGLAYDPAFVGPGEERRILDWLATLHPLWELRYPTRGPRPREQRRLLRPVYWLGSWQFACLDYYRPPAGVRDRCVRAEPFPDVLARLVERIDARVRAMFAGPDLPPRWRLNTCLVNLYGDRLDGGHPVDAARVGEHRDFEPGPVASVSLGERALFQFVDRVPAAARRAGVSAPVVAQQWLGHRSLQIFGGDTWKRRTLHRVQRVERRGGIHLPPDLAEFRTRRVNFTFRFVPDEHVVPFALLADDARQEVRAYVETLARHSPFFAGELARSTG